MIVTAENSVLGTGLDSSFGFREEDAKGKVKAVNTCLVIITVELYKKIRSFVPFIKDIQLLCLSTDNTFWYIFKMSVVFNSNVFDLMKE